MSKMKLLTFSAWQLWINSVAATKDCSCVNETDESCQALMLSSLIICNIF